MTKYITRAQESTPADAIGPQSRESAARGILHHMQRQLTPDERFQADQAQKQHEKDRRQKLLDMSTQSNRRASKLYRSDAEIRRDNQVKLALEREAKDSTGRGYVSPHTLAAARANPAIAPAPPKHVRQTVTTLTPPPSRRRLYG